MHEYISEFPAHLKQAKTYLEGFDFSTLPENKFSNVLICGLGGSGIGGKVVKDILRHELPIPVEINSNYTIPAWVNESTLLIISSYSGNTEETLTALSEAHHQGATPVCITSGGEVETFAKANNATLFKVPEGYPPRAAFAFSVAYQLALFNQIFNLGKNIPGTLENISSMLIEDENSIKERASELADTLSGTIPIIYADYEYEGIAVRFRQQINENAKMLCWHHIYPEMNHNELVGWAGGNESFAVVTLLNEDDHIRNKLRMDICKSIITKKTENFSEVESKGETKIERTFYLVHLLDWVSEYIAQLNNVDSVEVDVISKLKSQLKQQTV